MSRVTLQDVANAGGVSKMTASRALRDHSDVSGTTKEKIQKLAKEMGYVPNQMASMLSAKSAPIIPMIIPSLSNIVFVDIVNSAQALIHKADFQMMLVNTNYSLDEEEKAIASMMAWSPSALITSGLEHTDQARLLLEKAPFPVIEIMDVSGPPIGISVGFDHFQAGVDMGTYLIGQGYQRMVFCGQQIHLDKRARKRFEGFRQVLKEAGMNDPQVVNANHGYGVLAEEDLKTLLSENSGVDCIYFSNDDLAIAALLMCQKMGLKVPEDIAIAGFNDILLGRMTTPTLTTTRTPRGLIGKTAAELAIKAISDGTINQRSVDLSSELIPRESA